MSHKFLGGRGEEREMIEERRKEYFFHCFKLTQQVLINSNMMGGYAKTHQAENTEYPSNTLISMVSIKLVFRIP